MNAIHLNFFPTVSAPATTVGKFLAALTLSLVTGVVPAFANDNGCSNATLKGDYGFTITGYEPNPMVPRAL